MKNLQNTICNTKKELTSKILELKNVKSEELPSWVKHEDYLDHECHLDDLESEISDIKMRISSLEKMEIHLNKNPIGLDMIRQKIA